MATKEEVQKLASLARLSVPEDQLEKFVQEFDAVLEYVGQLEKLEVKKSGPFLPYTNVMREDGVPHAKGKYTKKLVEQFPARDEQYLEVKQIVNYD